MSDLRFFLHSPFFRYFPRLFRSRRKFVLFLIFPPTPKESGEISKKEPSSAVENRRGPRSEIGGPGGDFRRQTAKRKIEVLLISLKLFLPTHEWVGKNSFHLSFPGKKDPRLPSKIASDFRRQAPGPLRFLRNRRRRRKKDLRSFFLEKKIFDFSFSEIGGKPVFYSFLPGTDQRSVPGRNRCFLRFLAPFSFGKRANFFLFLRNRKKYRNRRKTRFFHTFFSHVFFTEPFMAREKNLSHKWLGKKILAIYGSEKNSYP